MYVVDDHRDRAGGERIDNKYRLIITNVSIVCSSVIVPAIISSAALYSNSSGGDSSLYLSLAYVLHLYITFQTIIINNE